MAKFFIDQHGCAKNQVDGEIIIAHLLRSGWVFAENPAAADLIIVNSCGFIESAKKESIGAVIASKRDFPAAKVLLAGCLAERYADDLAENFAEADGIFGNGDLSQVANAAQATLAGRRPKQIFAQKGVCSAERNVFLSSARSVFVKITEGCDNRCSFCAIPLIRGPLRSRKIAEIAAEVRFLTQKKNFFEINLIGQDLASFGRDSGESLAALLRELDSIDGEFWIRLLYIHPDNFPLEILPIIAKSKKILRYFDIPFQSGDEKTLFAMNRRGNSQKYLDLAKKISEFLPNFALRTTFLTGFPAESEESFANTLDFLKKIKPLWSGTFVFSKEDGTAAEKIKGKVAKKIAKSRKDILDSAQTEISQEKLKKFVEKKERVLIEEVLPAKDGGENFAIGRAWFQATEVDGVVVLRFDGEEACKIFAGAVVQAKFDALSGLSLLAHLE